MHVMGGDGKRRSAGSYLVDLTSQDHLHLLNLQPSSARLVQARLDPPRVSLDLQTSRDVGHLEESPSDSASEDHDDDYFVYSNIQETHN